MEQGRDMDLYWMRMENNEGTVSDTEKTRLFFHHGFNNWFPKFKQPRSEEQLCPRMKWRKEQRNTCWPAKIPADTLISDSSTCLSSSSSFTLHSGSNLRSPLFYPYNPTTSSLCGYQLCSYGFLTLADCVQDKTSSTFTTLGTWSLR